MARNLYAQIFTLLESKQYTITSESLGEAPSGTPLHWHEMITAVGYSSPHPSLQ